MKDFGAQQDGDLEMVLQAFSFPGTLSSGLRWAPVRDGEHQPLPEEGIEEHGRGRHCHGDEHRERQHGPSPPLPLLHVEGRAEEDEGAQGVGDGAAGKAVAQEEVLADGRQAEQRVEPLLRGKRVELLEVGSLHTAIKTACGGRGGELVMEGEGG